MSLSYAEQRMHLRFISATNEVAQHPSAGVAVVGATATRYLMRGDLTPEQVFTFGERGNAPEPVVAVTGAEHALVSAYPVPRDDLRRSVGFAYGLVGHGVVSTVAEMGKGSAGIVLPHIEVATPEQKAQFQQVVEDPGHLTFVHRALGDVASALTDITNPEVQDPIDEYHQTILAVSTKYGKDHANPGRMAELGAARDALAQDLTEPVIDALAPHMSQAEAGVTAQNILRHNPGPELLATHFGAPPA